MREPTAESEFEVQALLWGELRRLGLNIRGEVKMQLDGRAYCRFDLAEFRGGELVGVIEVKSAPISHRSAGGWNSTRQGTRYGLVGVPVRVVYGRKQAELLIAEVESGEDLWA